MSVTLSVLDQSPIVHGATPRDAIEATIALARRAETLGYHRYWLAEHHALPSLADTAPEIMIARLSGETATIRLGSGGIMLPHYSSFKVAETFRMLEALAPGRVDLGVGRAPGGTRLVSAALRSGDPERFPEQILETLAYLAGTVADPRFNGLVAQPAGESAPVLWILGSSDFGAQLAAQLGLPYAFAQFIGGQYPQVTRIYRDTFQPSPWSAAPRVIVTFAALVAPTDEEADALALPALLSRLRRLRGLSAPLPSLAEAQAYPWTPGERAEVAASRNIITGSPATVCARLATLAAEYHADELMIVTIAPDYATRMRSYELLADGWRAANTSGNAAVTSMSAAPA